MKYVVVTSIMILTLVGSLNVARSGHELSNYFAAGFFLVGAVLTLALGNLMERVEKRWRESVKKEEDVEEEEEGPAEDFARKAKKLFGVLVSVGFSEEGAIKLIKNTRKRFSDYDDEKQFAEELWCIRNALVDQGFSEEQVIELISAFWHIY